jgi:hypothetical protein
MDRRRILIGGLIAVAFAAGLGLGRLLDGGAPQGGGDGEPSVGGAEEPSAQGIDWSDPQPLPEPRRDDYRSKFVRGQAAWRFWPRSGRVEPGVAYRFDTGHCGLQFLTDFDRSFWEPVDPKEGNPPTFFYNQDVGAIALVAPNEAIYRSSNGREVPLVRLGGPVSVTGLCA